METQSTILKRQLSESSPLTYSNTGSYVRNVLVPRHGSRSRLRLSVAVNLILLGILFALHTDRIPLASHTLNHWQASEALPYHPYHPKEPETTPLREASQVIVQKVADVEERLPRLEPVQSRVPEPAVPFVGGSCSMCAVGTEVCERLSEAGMLKALSYGGSGDRIKRLIAKLRQGERLTVGVVGGSVSGGHGLYDKNYDMRNTADNLNRRVFDHLDALFPAPNGWVQNESGRKEDKNSFINGAQGGTGTGYFSRCFMEHLPEDMDLVLIEQAINDEVNPHNANSYELLVRGLLDLPRKPAIINLHVFQLLFAQIYAGGDMHHGIAEYYDLPVLSIRNTLLHEAIKNQSFVRELFYTPPGNWVGLEQTDKRHIGPLGHKAMGQIAIAYIDHIRCEMEKREAALGLDPLTLDIDTVYPVPELPRLLIVDQYHETDVFPTLAPTCLSANSERHKLVMAEGSSGWREWNWEKKNYLISNAPGSIVTFAFTSSLGEVTLNYLRSAEFGLGTAECWVDDDRHRHQMLDGYWNLPYNIGQERTIRDDLEPGAHLMHCELQDKTSDPGGGTEFRIISLTSL